MNRNRSESRSRYYPLGNLRAHAYKLFFGDRVGLSLFLGALCFFGLYWRVGVYITDTNAIVNTLLNVADGRLHLVDAPYGVGLEAPGTYVSDGRPYGRNYGIVFLALPFYWALQGLATVFDPRIVVVAGWSLALLGFFKTVSVILDRHAIAVVGSLVAVGAFLLNVAVATPLDPALFPVLALQLPTMIAAALAGVLIYRLVARIYSHRLAVAAGVATVAATPVGFWASFPKRHSFTVVLLLGTLYALYRSRAASDASTALTFRALAYVPVGLTAWVHAAEALLLFVPLFVVDVGTARSNDRRTIGVVAGVFLLSLAPFFVTNLAITGSPVKAPRMLPSYTSQPEALDLAGGTGDTGGIQIPIVSDSITIATVFSSLLWDGVVTSGTEPDRLYHTFLRSGFLPSIAAGDGWQAISLSVLESAPLVGGLVAVPLVVGDRIRSRGTPALRNHVQTPAGAVDCLVLTYVVGLILLYIPKLPLHAQVTVRYLHPVFPLGVYTLARIPAIRTVIESRWRAATWAYAGSVFIGGQLLVVAMAVVDPVLGEALQFHALVAVVAGTVLAVWVLAATITDVPNVIGAVVLGGTTGAGTVFLLLSGLDYFAYAGDFALPAVRALTDAVALV